MLRINPQKVKHYPNIISHYFRGSFTRSGYLGDCFSVVDGLDIEARFVRGKNFGKLIAIDRNNDSLIIC